MDRSQLRLGLEVLCLAGAFVAALLFNGKDIYFFALSLGAVVLWAMLLHKDVYQRTHRLPLNLFTLSLFGFWLWLGIQTLFATVSYVSMVNFWWVGSLFLVAVLYFAGRHHEPLWRFAVDAIVLICAGLAGLAIYQYFILNASPSGTFFNKNSLAALFNLMLFLLFYRFSQAPEQRAREDRPFILLGLILLFSFAIGLIASRGAFIAFIVSAIIFFGVLYTRMSWRQRGWLLGTCLVGFALANMLGDSGLGARMGSLADPQSAGAARWSIWGGAWRMFLDAPWYGIGLGTYWLAWPPYRAPEDATAGFYVHNDYLQIAIETGLPGIVLLLAALAGIALWFVRLWRSDPDAGGRCLELTAVFCALASVAIHSLFTFNLYILPIDLVVGLCIGRFVWLGQHGGATPRTNLTISKWLRPAVFRFLYFTVLIVTLVFFALLCADRYLFAKASELSKQGKLKSAHETYLLSETILPFLDLKYYSHAQMLLRAARSIPPGDEAAKQEMVMMVDYLLDRAVALNPWRAQPHLIRGMLFDYLQQPEPAMAAFEQALQRDPLYLPARIELVKQLINRDRSKQARARIEQGLAYTYRLNRDYLTFLRMAAHFYMNQGDEKRAQQLRRQYELNARKFRAGSEAERAAGGPVQGAPTEQP